MLRPELVAPCTLRPWQGNTLEVKAAQLQSVESSSAQFASRTHGVEKGGDSLGRLGGGVRAPSGDGANGQLADEHGTVVGSKAVDVAPEDLPSTVRIVLDRYVAWCWNLRWRVESPASLPSGAEAEIF